MLSHFGKYKCPHKGHGNVDVNNKMGDTVLGTTLEAHVITQSAYIKVAEQCLIAASKSNDILGLIRRCLINMYCRYTFN